MMKAKHLLMACSLASLVVMIALYVVSQLGGARKNGFKRIFRTSRLVKVNETDIRYYAYYLAGLTGDRIYLGNQNAPLHLLSIDYELKDTMSIHIPIQTKVQANWNAVNVQIDSPAVFLSERTTSLLISKDLSFKKETKYYLHGLRFDFLKVLTDSLLLIRYYDFELKQKVFQKIQLYPYKASIKRYMPEKQMDGVFSLDGCIAYEKRQARIVHAYYYSNQFDCLDTNLKVLYRGRTIDTNRSAKITLQEIKSTTRKETLMSGPPVYVNKRTYIDGNLIYINSAVIADNETTAEFKNNAVIDVYALEDGKYQYSFYIPIDQDGRIHDFALRNGLVMALYKHRLITYRFN